MQQILLKPILPNLLNTMQTTQQALVEELGETELAAIGTPERWSARDHVAHITFWKQRLLLIIAAIARNETPPRFDNFEQLNALVFEEQHARQWPDILRESQQTHVELLERVQHFTEDELASSQWFPAEAGDNDIFPGGRPLWDTILGNGYWHPQAHFVQFYMDRNAVASAARLWETWISDLEQLEAPPAMRGIALYNLACFYATTQQVEKASAVLQQALQFNPDLTVFSKRDPDLASLREP